MREKILKIIFNILLAIDLISFMHLTGKVLQTKPILSCCDVINFGTGEGKGGRKLFQMRWEKWGSPFNIPFPFPKFMTSQQDNMGFIVISVSSMIHSLIFNNRSWFHYVWTVNLCLLKSLSSLFNMYFCYIWYEINGWI